MPNDSSFSTLVDALIAQPPEMPSRWTRRYLGEVLHRINRRIETLQDRIDDLRPGRVPPTLDQIAIGSGRQYDLAVLFLDICSFSLLPSSNHREQRIVLAMLDIFMAEMMNISRDFSGTFEKNTGDGLMAYFGAEAASQVDSVRMAVEAGVIMHYINDQHIAPLFISHGLPPIRFRLGIDFGQVTIGRVGVPGGLNSFVAIGSVANCACKLMQLLQMGGICIGNEVYRRLPRNWSLRCRPIPQPTGFYYVQNNQPYPAWELIHRLLQPIT